MKGGREKRGKQGKSFMEVLWWESGEGREFVLSSYFSVALASSSLPLLFRGWVRGNCCYAVLPGSSPSLLCSGCGGIGMSEWLEAEGIFGLLRQRPVWWPVLRCMEIWKVCEEYEWHGEDFGSLRDWW